MTFINSSVGGDLSRFTKISSRTLSFLFIQVLTQFPPISYSSVIPSYIKSGILESKKNFV